MASIQEMECPTCHDDEIVVVEIRGNRRRRECKACRHRWNTYEITAERLEQLETIEQHAAAIAGAMAKEPA